MNPIVSYLVACFVMTVLWLMATLGPIAVIAGLVVRLFADSLTLHKRDLCRQAVLWGFVSFIVACPLLRTLYAFWGHWQ